MVFDVPPQINAGINATIDQGTEFVRSGSFADPNPDSWTATVDYGDGSGVQPLALNPDKTFTLDHTYTTPGNYVVGVTIIDSQGGQGHGYFAVQVQTPSTPNPPAPSTAGTTGTPVPGGTSQGQPQVQATTTTTGQTTATSDGTTGESAESIAHWPRQSMSTCEFRSSPSLTDTSIIDLRAGPRSPLAIPKRPR